MSYKLTELIEVPKLQSLIDNFYTITGLAATVTEIDGETVLVASKWADICANFHKKNSISFAKCKESNMEIRDELYKGNNYAVRECKNGLIDVCTSIMVNDNHIATLFIGQFFFHEPDMEFYRLKAREFGIDEEDYLEQVKKVPIVPPEQIERIVKFLTNFSEILAEMGYRHLKQLEMQRKLQVSEERWQYALEGSGDGVWDWDVQTNEIIFSGRYMEMLGYEGNETWSSSFDWEKNLHPDDHEKTLNEIKKCLNGEISNYSTEHRLRCKDGSYKWILARGKIMSRTHDGKPLRMVGTHEDISGNKRMEEELKKAKEKAEEASQYKSEYIANMSHELRTPLTVLFGAVQLLESYFWKDSVSNSDKASKHLRSIRQNGLRLLRLVNNLIDTTKIDAGFYEIHLRNYNIISIVKGIILSVVEYTKQKGIELVFKSEVEEKMVVCDVDMVERIMLNLLSNAIKFTNSNGVITVTIREDDKNILISVKDNGIGIPSDKQSKIFERYNQVNRLLTREHEGSGIGLSLIKSIIEMHGGRLSVKSEYGIGSEFIVELPTNVLPGDNTRQECTDYKPHNKVLIERMNVEFADIYK